MADNSIIRSIVREAFASPKLRDALVGARTKNTSMHNLNNLEYQSKKMDGIPHGDEYVDWRKGVGSERWLDKISDDMIDFIGSPEELKQQGYDTSRMALMDAEGDPRYTIRLNDGNVVVLGKSPRVKAMIKSLSTQAGLNQFARGKKHDDRNISNRFNAMTPKAYAAREYRTNPYPWMAKQGEEGIENWSAEHRAKAMDNIRNGKDAYGDNPAEYMPYLRNENKQMKKQLFKITPSDIVEMVTKIVKRRINEGYFADDNPEYSLGTPQTYFYNRDTQEITTDCNDLGFWIEFLPNRYVNGNFKIVRAFIDHEDGTEEEVPQNEVNLDREEIDYIGDWIEEQG